jgi:hypothetical protein
MKDSANFGIPVGTSEERAEIVAREMKAIVSVLFDQGYDIDMMTSRGSYLLRSGGTGCVFELRIFKKIADDPAQEEEGGLR